MSVGRVSMTETLNVTMPVKLLVIVTEGIRTTRPMDN